MRRRSAFGVGLAASAFFGVGSIELVSDTMDSIGNIDGRRQDVTTCADTLSEEADIVREVPPECSSFASGFELSALEIPEDLPRDRTHYELPARQSFLNEQMNELGAQEESGERAAEMLGVLVAMGGLAIGYRVARGKDFGD